MPGYLSFTVPLPHSPLVFPGTPLINHFLISKSPSEESKCFSCLPLRVKPSRRVVAKTTILFSQYTGGLARVAGSSSPCDDSRAAGVWGLYRAGLSKVPHAGNLTCLRALDSSACHTRVLHVCSPMEAGARVAWRTHLITGLLGFVPPPCSSKAASRVCISQACCNRTTHRRLQTTPTCSLPVLGAGSQSQGVSSAMLPLEAPGKGPLSLFPASGSCSQSLRCPGL